MAKKYLVVCDLHDDDTTTGETLSFGLDGGSYEIDVCDDHAAEIRDSFARFVGLARRADGTAATGGRRTAGRSAPRSTGGGSSTGAPSGGPDRERVQQIREWARANGHTVSERGRLSASVQKAYDEAH